MNLKNNIVGILGVGEVGSSLLPIIKKQYTVLVKDLNRDEIGDTKLDVLHICIPYSDMFEDIVLAQIKQSDPDLVIIDSTLPLLTTEKIAEKTSIPLVHSPIRGTHPGMTEDLLKFMKFIGPTTKEAGVMAKEYYDALGIQTTVLSSSRETEMGKLLDTTYYALCIAWHQEMERWCEEFGILFDEAVTLFNKTYNEGYRESKPNVLRPVLAPGFIGGHCLMPNIELLKKTFKSPFLKIIEESNETKKKKSKHE